VIEFIDRKGKDLYGLKFKLQKDDLQLILKLAGYFLRDEEFCAKENINLDKGIMLTGPIGSGKTSLLNICRFLGQGKNNFIIKSTRDITFEFIQDGYFVIHKYSRGNLYSSNYRNYCFDDLGSEQNMKLYGNECNVMAEILLSRYDLFISKGLQTHVTTNLSATELELAYGNRLRSRLREMLNLISFDTKVPDKRK